MPEGPKISAEILQEDGFGDDKFFHCLVAEQGSEVCSNRVENFKKSNCLIRS